VVNLTVHATPDRRDALVAQQRVNTIGLHLFGKGTPQLPGLGSQLDRYAKRDLPGTPSVPAWDFLSIAMAAFAADRFVVRAGSPNGWTRVIGLEIALVDPVAWRPLQAKVEAALRFLTGDVWHLSFRDGGQPAPNIPQKQHDRDAICLFSGGLDSFLGALALQNDRRRPFLVSQGSTKEIGPQINLAAALGLTGHRFEGRVAERWRQPYEGSTRARSILFFGYGAVAASACGLPEVLVPENGLIAINPPFTVRRMGSLSTRTTHPHFIALLNEIWAAAGLGLTIRNPCFDLTKGEMLRQASHLNLAALAAASYSCGKGKRANMQCGRCVPCLIRRASFHAAGIGDATIYQYGLSDSSRFDDVLAARQAVARHSRATQRELQRLVRKAGPLPDDPRVRAATIAAVGRGLAELENLFNTVRWR
jgi:hypothetical protein